MKKTKALFLFLALLLPVLVFLFLRFFGKNEFAVPPLYTETFPEVPQGCAPVKALPYHIADSVRRKLPFGDDSLALVTFGELSSEAINQLKRVGSKFPNDPVVMVQLADTKPDWKQCVFFLKPPFDWVLVDRRGTIRGQYTSGDLDEADRLITEITIILKKY